MSNAAPAGRTGSSLVVLRKVLLSVLIGAAALAVTTFTDPADQSAMWGITLSVFFAGVAMVVQFLMGFEGRLAQLETANARHSGRVEEVVAQGFTKINEGTALLGRIESAAVSGEAIIGVVDRATRLGPEMPPLIRRFAEVEMSRLSATLRGLGDGGTMLYDGEDRDWLLGLTRAAESRVDATSLTTVDASGGGFTDGGFWASDLGQRYLEAQQDAVRRKVAIRRVFIILNSADAPVGLDAVCRLQRDCGIDVRVLREDAIPPRLRDSMFDFIVFDGVVSYEVTAATRLELATQPVILDTRMELRADRVKARGQRFEALWQAAHEVW